MANEKAKKKSADKTADKSKKDLKDGKGGKTAADKTADKAASCYKSLEKKVPKKKRSYLKAALNHATDKELEAVKRVKTKNSGFATVLAITPLGWLGLDRFYIGDILRAITKILATIIIALSLVARFLPYYKDVESSPVAPGTPSAGVQLTDSEDRPEKKRFTLPNGYVGIWENNVTGDEKMTIYLYANGAEVANADGSEKLPVLLEKGGSGSNVFYYINMGVVNFKLELKSGKLVISPYEKPDEGGTTNPDQGGTTNPDEGGTTNPDEGGTTNPDEGGTTNPDEGGTTNPDEGGTTNPDEGGSETVKFTVALEESEPADGGNTTDPGQGGTTNPDEGGDDTQEPAEEPDPFTFTQKTEDGKVYRAGVPENLATIIVIALCAVFGLYLLLDIFLTGKKAKKDNYYKVMKILAPEADE